MYFPDTSARKISSNGADPGYAVARLPNGNFGESCI
jgi:hypothetical protein